MSMTGKNYKVKFADGSHIGGIVQSASIDVDVDVTREAATEGNTIVYIKPALAVTKLNMKLKVKRLENFIADYSGTNKHCFVSGEADQTPFDLIYTDGIDTYELTDCLVNKCSLNIPVRGTITAEVEIWAKSASSTTFGSDPPTISESPLDITNVNSFLLNSVDIKGTFKDITVTVDHKLEATALGTSFDPAELIEKATEYSIKIDRVLKTQSFTSLAVDALTAPITFQINDNQATPTKTQFVFSGVYISSHKKNVNELDIITESIDCVAKSLTLNAGI